MDKEMPNNHCVEKKHYIAVISEHLKCFDICI